MSSCYRRRDACWNVSRVRSPFIIHPNDLLGLDWSWIQESWFTLPIQYRSNLIRPLPKFGADGFRRWSQSILNGSGPLIASYLGLHIRMDDPLRNNGDLWVFGILLAVVPLAAGILFVKPPPNPLCNWADKKQEPFHSRPIAEPLSRYILPEGLI